MPRPNLLTSAVAMATYNGAHHVETQLRSLAGQTRRLDQLVVFDDASIDGTVGIVRGLAPTVASDVVIAVEAERLGPVGNFERALQRVTADVVFLCDQDDVWDPVKVETLMARFEADKRAGGAFSDGTLLSRDPKLDGKSLWEVAGFSGMEQRLWAGDPMRVLLRRNVVTGAALAVRTRLLSSFLPLPKGGWHDLSLAVLVAATGARLEAVPDRLIHYRIHESNAVGLPVGCTISRVLDRETHLSNLDAQTAHWEGLRSRLVDLGCDPFVLARIDGKLYHLRSRRALPTARRARVVPVVRAALRGAYRRYANDPWSVVRDIAGP